MRFAGVVSVDWFGRNIWAAKAHHHTENQHETGRNVFSSDRDCDPRPDESDDQLEIRKGG